jgi:hypothetical protein
MSTRKLTQAVQNLFQQVSRLARSIAKGLTSWLLRGLLIVGRKPASNRAGFVLPTTILLLLVVSVTVGAITYRTFTRTSESINERQQRVIYNAATPAIDRAKAKLEFMFDVQRDGRYPGGVPRQSTLVSMMLNQRNRNVGIGTVACSYIQNPPTGGCDTGYDPYTFPDETRIDIGGDPANLASVGVDNAWRYPVDLNGNGTTTDTEDGLVAYSIIFQTPPDTNTLRNSNRNPTNNVPGVNDRATKLQIRQGPLSATKSISASCSRQNSASDAELEAANTGWFQDGTSATLRKNFQVDAFVLPNDPKGTIATLEFTQDRQINRGNKWGAWFRNDLEIFPGPPFNWNGAMHTEGNLIIGGENNKFTGYLISAPNSCFYTLDASEVTVTKIDATPTNVAAGIPVFQGQVINGTMKLNNFDGKSTFHVYNGPGVLPLQSDAGVVISASTDSLLNTGGSPAKYSVDPVILLTEGFAKGREVANPAADQDIAYWNSRPQKQVDRIDNTKPETTPYVDDSYRADDRYGPKPTIGGTKVDKIGLPIGTTHPEWTRNDPPSTAQGTEFGLDGYWERRARYEGMRLIVGQRLELGNAFGWGRRSVNDFDAKNEPLRPWGDDGTICADNDISSNICNEARQRRTLYDNLAAVQATAVYHSAKFPATTGVDRDYPIACLATTVHPGTPYTLERSSTFNDLNYDFGYNSSGQISDSLTPISTFPAHSIISDFFHGKGTNGWEYKPHDVSEFIDSSSPLRRALKNLAYFAGDPKGGMPSFSTGGFNTQQDQLVHPLPNMAMWGDYSNLRHVIDLLDTGTSYSNLSPADKTTLQTAACTLGMLAYNIRYLQKYDVTKIGIDLTELNNYIGYLFTNASPSNSLAGSKPLATVTTPPTNPANLQPEDVIAGLQAWQDNAMQSVSVASQPDIEILVKLTHIAQMLATQSQVWRDIHYGFKVEGGSSPRDPGNPGNPCDKLTGANVRSLCSDKPRYPILYSIFPAENHNEKAGYIRDKQDMDVRFIERAYIEGANPVDAYQKIDITDDGEMDRIALKPRPLSEWTLPKADAGVGKTPNSNRDVLIRDCAGPCLDYSFVGSSPTPSDPKDRLISVPFKDSAMFNGREMMNVRVMDMNLELMRASATNLLRADYWLPLSGVMYLFREDAVSESNIVRPKAPGVIWDNCKTDATIQTPLCRMQTQKFNNAYESKDPPLNSNNLITPKPVDYYADPDRRPNGFRLRNGIRLDRPGDTTGRGLTLVSDDPVYIQGDFNLHQDATGGGRLEEFSELLNDTFSNFYTRSNLEAKFASPANDRWRPAEILADAISILSINFCDGSIEDVMRTAGQGPAAKVSDGAQKSYNCQGNSNITSYLNIDGLKSPPGSASIPVSGGVNYWRRSDLAESQYFGTEKPLSPTDPLNTQKRTKFVRSPILINKQGNPVVFNNGNGNSKPYDGTYYTAKDPKPRIVALDGTRVNAIIVSGLVPSRPNQSYGGLHNFPRFLEDWQNRKLYISGSFLQLNFSNYATGPFDQDAFEVGATPVGGTDGEYIKYYSPPDRRWGYDVGLQYAPAGPLAQRFITLKSIRSEFYTEPPADDPYIKKLCTALTQRC